MVLDGFDLTVPAGQSVALVGATGTGKTTVARLIPRFYDVDAGAVLRRRRRRAATCACGSCARRSASCSRTRSSSPTASPPTSPSPIPTRRWSRSPAPPVSPAPHEFIEDAARGLRHAHRRARLLAVGRPAPAPRHRPGDPRRPPGADPRRRHVVGRPHQGARDPRRARRGDARPHHDRHRPPAGHDRARRPGRAARATAGWSPTAPTTSLLGSSAEYREVLAAAEAREHEVSRDADSDVAGVD